MKRNFWAMEQEKIKEISKIMSNDSLGIEIKDVKKAIRLNTEIANIHQ